jgi:hypothetical protein
MDARRGSDEGGRWGDDGDDSCAIVSIERERCFCLAVLVSVCLRLGYTIGVG